MSEDYADWRAAEGPPPRGQGVDSPLGDRPRAPPLPARRDPDPAAQAPSHSPERTPGAEVAAAASGGASAGRLRGWWAAAPPNLRGSLMMVAAFTFFSGMMVLIKLVGHRLPLPQILVVRQVVMTLVLMAVVGRALPTILRTSRPGLQVLRGVFSLGAMLCGFTALINLPMAEATALGFSQALFVTLLAIFVLHEVVDWRRWLAMAVGFLGVLVMLRPAGEAMNIYALLAIAGALFGAGITITVRVLGHTERTETILFWQGGMIVAALIGPTLWFWVPPTPLEWLFLIVLGVVGTAGQWFITRAYQVGEASALAPLDFVRLLLAVLSGYLVFSEIPSLITALGAGLIAGGTLYTMRRNSAPRRPPEPPVD